MTPSSLSGMEVPEIDVAELARLRADGAPLIDVREPDEYTDAHVPGATLIPLATVPDEVDAGAVRRHGVRHLRQGRSQPPGRRVLPGPGHRRRERRGRHDRLDRRGPAGLDGDGAVTPAPAPSGYRWVDSQREFDAFLDAAADADAFALDTEFHRERTYYARLALLQLTAGDDIVLVDPLAVDVGPLRRLLDSDAECIMHAASQDLEILERACGVVPRRLVDTQIAAGFVGLGSPGLGVLLQRRLGVNLPKADRLADWLRRPLGEDALAYAAADVAYLHALWASERDELVDRGAADMGARRVRPGPRPSRRAGRPRRGVVAHQGGPPAEGPGPRRGPGGRRVARGARPHRSTGRSATCCPTCRSSPSPSARPGRGGTSDGSVASTAGT